MPAPTIVQIGTAFPSGSVSSLSIPVTSDGVPVGSTILVFIFSATPVVSVVDSQGNSYVRDLLNIAQSSGMALQIWRCTGAASLFHADTISVTVNAATATVLAIATYYLGLLLSSSPLDTSAASAGTGITAASGVTPIVAGGNEFLIGVIGAFNSTTSPQTFTPGTGYTTSAQLSGVNVQELMLFTESQYLSSASGPQSASGTLSLSSNYWSAAILVYKMAPGITIQSTPDPTLALPYQRGFGNPVPSMHTHTTRHN